MSGRKRSARRADFPGWAKYPKVPGLDPGISRAVDVLRRNGIHTIESCQGGEGHAYAEPTVLFDGPYSDGLRALSLAVGCRREIARQPLELRRVWRIQEGEPQGPYWELQWA
ncbi:MAG: hypothetical protein ABSG37_09965 [Candidatus Limnocylindrales bacterium]|jgi:hypothetical protein